MAREQALCPGGRCDRLPHTSHDLPEDAREGRLIRGDESCWEMQVMGVCLEVPRSRIERVVIPKHKAIPPPIVVAVFHDAAWRQIEHELFEVEV